MIIKVGERNYKKYAWLVLIVFLALTGVLAYRAKFIKFDYDFEKFFPANDPDTDFFNAYRKHFKSDNDFLLISIERKRGIFDLSFLKEVERSSQALKKIEFVESVASITSLKEHFIHFGNTTTSRKYIDFSDFDSKRDSSRIYKNKELINTFVSSNGKSISLLVNHENYISREKSDLLVDEVLKTMDLFKFEKVRVAGRTIGQKFYINKMFDELIMYIGIGGVLIIFFLFVAFRSLWGVVLPLIVIASSVIWLIGFMEVFKIPINIILTVIPTIMFVVGMSDVIHLVSRYIDAFREHQVKFESIKIALNEVGMSTFLTSITTAIGFFSLYFVNVQPIQIFGIVMGIGVLTAFFLTYLILPVLIFLMPSPKFTRTRKGNHFWKKHLENGFRMVLRRKFRVLFVSGVVVLISLLGMFKIESNNYMMDDIKSQESLKQDFNFFDEHYGGFRPFELAIILKDTNQSFWDYEVLNKIDSIEQFLTEEYGVNIKNSLVQAIQIVNRSTHAGNPSFYSLPLSDHKIRSFRRPLKMAGKGQYIRTILDSNETMSRISGTIPDWGNQKVSAKNKELLAKIESMKLEDKIEFKITGTAHLLDRNMQYLAASLIKGLALSILIVALIIGLIFRSFAIVLISLVPNILPLLFIAGIMGFFSIDLKTSTAIIFTIAFGIAVDDTIHLLGKYRLEITRERSELYALKRSYLTTGKAMILTTLILCSGFLLLVFSDFLGTFYLGIMLCVTLLVALVADLTLLPALLLIFFKKRG